MKQILVLSSFSLLFCLVLSGCLPDSGGGPGIGPTADWTFQLAGTSEKLLDVFFVDGNRGWAVGEKNILLATTDGGDTMWPIVPSSGTTPDLRSVFFIDGITGWVAGGVDASGTTQGQVFISEMGGAYPTEQKKITRPLNTLFFLDETHGWAGGDSSILLRTENGGTTWTQSQIGVNRKILHLQFLNSTTGWAAMSGGGIYRTKDGSTWIPDNSGISSDIYAIQFVDTLHAWACGASNTILRRTLDINDNPVWLSMTIDGEPVNTIWHDLYFLSDKLGWITGTGGNVYKTIDGGLTWTQETTESSEDLYGIHMVNSTRGWVVGDKGIVLKYTPM